MNKGRFFKASALRSVSAVGLAIGMSGAAFAQEGTTERPGEAAAEEATQSQDPVVLLDTEPEIESGEAATRGAEIVVTGSRIRRPNLESVVPITSIGGEEFFQQGHTNIGDSLNELPQLRSTFAQQNPGLGVGVAGLNLLDLRGLGTVRTLVLVNGRRHVGADILNNAVSPDVNTIPNDLIERVDIVTGGNSAIYGSDAIAGVVNFILRRDFQGLQVRGNAGVSEAGFGGNYYVSGMYGLNFGDGRGNVTVHGEYANQERIFGSEIPWFRRLDQFLVIDVDPAGLPAGSDGFPDRAFFRDVRSASINRFGLIPITQGANPQCGIGTGSTAGGPSTTGGLPFNCTFLFTPDGQLVPQTGTRIGQGIIGGIVGGNGQNGREEEILSVLPGMQRYNANLLAHFTVSSALEPFIEAKFVRVDARGSNAGPSFIQGTFTQFDIRERVRLDNPFLDPAERTALANAILTSGCNTSLTAACRTTAGAPTTRSTFGGQGVGGPLNADDIAAINAGTYRFVLARQLTDSGIRDEEFRRDTYRIVGGLRGTFNDDWSYELSANYGRMEEDTTTFGYLDRQRFLLSLDAGRNPETGQIQCRAQFDPAARVAFPNNADNLARLDADIAACVPYNPFGRGDNRAAADYFTYNARHRAHMEQLDFLGFVSGDSSQLFELPGGPVRFALGAEYRRENAFYEADPFVQGGFTNAVVIPTFDPPTFEVKEAFGEIQLPILRDLPVAHELTLSGAARVADYKGATGTVWAYNAGGEYAPIRDLRFRANYGRAVRAPNLSETGFPQVPNFAPGFLDPCAAGQIANNPNRQANCLAALGPALLAGLPNVAYSLPIISGSNPNLEEEVSDSITIGAVVQPRFIPGLSLSVDYYDIKVKNVIVSLTGQAIANNCYDQPSLNNVFCSLFTRWMGPGPDPLGALPGQIASNSLISAGVNFASRVRRGIDFEAAYRTNLGSDLRLDSRLIWTHNLKISNYENPALPDFENRILGEIGDPKNEFRWDLNFTRGPLTLGYQMNYIDKMVVNFYEDFFELPGACTAAGCPPNNLDWADITHTPEVFYHDVRLDWNIRNLGGVGRDFLFTIGVDNILNTEPPLGMSGTGALGADRGGGGTAAIYRIRGRNYFAGFRARF